MGDEGWGQPSFRFSTEELPEEHRVELWTEVFGRTLAKGEFKTIADAPFSQTVTVRSLPGLSVISGMGGGYQASRTARLIADGVDDFICLIHREGVSVTSQFGREVTVGAGEGVLVSSEDEAHSLFPGMSRYMILTVPRHALLDRSPDAEDCFMKPISKQSNTLRLLVGYLSLLDGGGAPLALEGELQLGPLFVSHAQDLCALALNPSKGTADRASSSLQAARLHAIKKDIMARLGQAELSVATLAAYHGITARYVQKLFDPEGVTFSEFVLRERLARTYRMLADPRFKGRTIASIAYEAGFSDLSHFNRAFRRRYSMTPSDVRKLD